MKRGRSSKTIRADQSRRSFRCCCCCCCSCLKMNDHLFFFWDRSLFVFCFSSSFCFVLFSLAEGVVEIERKPKKLQRRHAEPSFLFYFVLPKINDPFPVERGHARSGVVAIGCPAAEANPPKRSRKTKETTTRVTWGEKKWVNNRPRIEENSLERNEIGRKIPVYHIKKRRM